MKADEAIKILQKEWEKSVGDYRFQNPQKLEREDALDMAIEALRAMRERERLTSANISKIMENMEITQDIACNEEAAKLKASGCNKQFDCVYATRHLLLLESGGKTNEVKDICCNQPHIISEVVCLRCIKRWIAVRPEGTLLKDIQCPACQAVEAVIETGERIEHHE